MGYMDEDGYYHRSQKEKKELQKRKQTITADKIPKGTICTCTKCHYTWKRIGTGTRIKCPKCGEAKINVHLRDEPTVNEEVS